VGHTYLPPNARFLSSYCLSPRTALAIDPFHRALHLGTYGLVPWSVSTNPGWSNTGEMLVSAPTLGYKGWRHLSFSYTFRIGCPPPHRGSGSWDTTLARFPNPNPGKCGFYPQSLSLSSIYRSQPTVSRILGSNPSRSTLSSM
jgi:hypothetical protein